MNYTPNYLLPLHYYAYYAFRVFAPRLVVAHPGGAKRRSKCSRCPIVAPGGSQGPYRGFWESRSLAVVTAARIYVLEPLEGL
jgi:hypothetical protein